MSDRAGDPVKQSAECRAVMNKTRCPNIENTYEGCDSETWECKTCGEYFKLYYEDMA